MQWMCGTDKRNFAFEQIALHKYVCTVQGNYFSSEVSLTPCRAVASMGQEGQLPLRFRCCAQMGLAQIIAVVCITNGAIFSTFFEILSRISLAY